MARPSSAVGLIGSRSYSNGGETCAGREYCFANFHAIYQDGTYWFWHYLNQLCTIVLNFWCLPNGGGSNFTTLLEPRSKEDKNDELKFALKRCTSANGCHGVGRGCVHIAIIIITSLTCYGFVFGGIDNFGQRFCKTPRSIGGFSNEVKPSKVAIMLFPLIPEVYNRG